MSRPVQLKLFGGLMLLTRKSYLLLSLGGVAVLLTLWGGLTFFFGPRTWLGRHIVDLIPWFYEVLPWLCGAGLLLEIIEVGIVLQKFREREEFLARERSEFESPDDAEFL